MLIPDLKATWEAIKRAFIGAQYNDAGNLLSQFERQCRVSPDLVPADAQRLIEKARDMFRAQQSRMFAGGKMPGSKPGPLPEFDKLNLYG